MTCKMECPICFSIHSKLIHCIECEQSACTRCHYRYMEQTPSCMFCKSGWPASHIRTHFPKAKANQLLKTKYNVEFRRDVDANYHSLVSLHTRTLGMTSKLNKLLESKKELE